jgi:hypothetical protein
VNSALSFVLFAGVGSFQDAAVNAADQIRDAATLTSISLAVLSALAAQRATSLSAQRVDLGAFSPKQLLTDFGIDAAVTAFGVVLLVAAAPLFLTALGETAPLLSADTALFTLYCVFYVGVAFIVLWVAVTTYRRGRLLKDKTTANSLLEAVRKAWT